MAGPYQTGIRVNKVYLTDAFIMVKTAAPDSELNRFQSSNTMVNSPVKLLAPVALLCGCKPLLNIELGILFESISTHF